MKICLFYIADSTDIDIATILFLSFLEIIVSKRHVINHEMNFPPKHFSIVSHTFGILSQIPDEESVCT